MGRRGRTHGSAYGGGSSRKTRASAAFQSSIKLGPHLGPLGVHHHLEHEELLPLLMAWIKYEEHNIRHATKYFLLQFLTVFHENRWRGVHYYITSCQQCSWKTVKNCNTKCFVTWMMLCSSYFTHIIWKSFGVWNKVPQHPEHEDILLWKLDEILEWWASGHVSLTESVRRKSTTCPRRYTVQHMRQLLRIQCLNVEFVVRSSQMSHTPSPRKQFCSRIHNWICRRRVL